jgi:DNA invertase Pin-like site-specific DNA recombinase
MTEQAVLYARVAVGGEGAGKQELDRQLEACRQHVRDHGWAVVAELAEDEQGVSGSSLDRQQLNNILAMARSGQFDVLVVRDLCCLSRDLGNLLVLQEKLGQHGVQITSVQQADEMPMIVSLETITTECER